MYVVAGVTGQTGSVVADTLLSKGKPVKVIVRSPEKGTPWEAKGAKVVVADLGDAAALEKALQGAQGVYLLLPPPVPGADYFGDHRRLAATYAQAVRASGVPHVVLLSSVGAQHDSGTGVVRSLHFGEEALRPAAKNLTILRPPYFLENWVPETIPVADMPMPVTAKNDGVLTTFLTPDRKVPMIATRDIGQAAADTLLNPASGVRVIELAGPEDYSPQDIAGILSKLLNRDVRVEQTPLSAAVPAFTGIGFSEETARGLEELYAAINSGHADYEKRNAEFRRGKVTAREFFAGLLGTAASSAA
jgi:uncharacterized protein YbjT (DUF2867 family)